MPTTPSNPDVPQSPLASLITIHIPHCAIQVACVSPLLSHGVHRPQSPVHLARPWLLLLVPPGSFGLPFNPQEGRRRQLTDPRRIFARELCVHSASSRRRANGARPIPPALASCTCLHVFIFNLTVVKQTHWPGCRWIFFFGSTLLCDVCARSDGRLLRSRDSCAEIVARVASFLTG